MSETGKQSELPLPKGPFPDDVQRAVVQFLTSLKSAGIGELPASTGNIDFSGGVQETRTVYSKTSSTSSMYENSASYGPAVAAGDRLGSLQIVENEVAACVACEDLAKTRKQTVFGVGTSQPRLVFVGEAPGADEDRLGEPFVGAAGQLLTKIIDAMGLKRDDVYILNTLKCRPPGNRNPKETELRNCCHFTERQLEILQPEFICCLGSIAAKTLLNSNQSIGRLRGNFYRWRGSRVLATYHPAYLLRTPSAKKLVWDDMKLLMREMGLEK